MCSRVQASQQSGRVQRKKRQRRSAAGARVPRSITAAALRHFTGMRVDSDAVSCVEEMYVFVVFWWLSTYTLWLSSSCAHCTVLYNPYLEILN